MKYIIGCTFTPKGYQQIPIQQLQSSRSLLQKPLMRQVIDPIFKPNISYVINNIRREPITGVITYTFRSSDGATINVDFNTCEEADKKIDTLI